MHTFPLADYMIHITNGNWQEVARMMLASVRKLADVGADFAISPDNTIHEAYDLVAPDSPIPWMHIAEAVGMEARRRNFRRLAILGTKYLMTGPVYPQTLEKIGIGHLIPEKADREGIDEIIFEELVNGQFREESRQYFNEVIEKLKALGCDAVVLGCTEIPLLVDPTDCPLPTLDSTRLLARAALAKAFSG
jgi:aspartate racemase